MLNSVTTHVILHDKQWFSNLTLHKANVYIISSIVELIDGSRYSTVFLTNDTILHIENALLRSRSNMNLLGIRNVLQNGYHFETVNEQDKVYLCITSYKVGLKIGRAHV